MMEQTNQILNKTVSVSWAFMRDDCTKNLSPMMQYLDKQATESLMSTEVKFQHFKDWLLENGAVFDKIQFPSVFTGGLKGLSAKSEIPPNNCFISIPNKCVLSVALVM